MDQVQEIKEKINIVDIISPYVKLKKAGVNHKGLCPFHKEKTPSFVVSEVMQFYKCFGCGKSGDVYKFLQDIEGVDFSESLKILADKVGIKLDPGKFKKGNKDDNNEKLRMYKLNELAANLYNNLLINHELGEKTLEYLYNRGLDKKTIDEFKLGYSPNNWSALSDYLVKKGFEKSFIVKSGLAKLRKDNSLYDLYRGRLIFPFVDFLGKVIGFSARSLDGSKPKYINTPDTPVFKKSKFLYGLYLTKKYIREEKYVVLVEGQFDLITPYKYGVKNIVATGGTSLTEDHINLIKKYTDTIVLVFDNDIAGLETSSKVIDMIVNQNVNLKIGLLDEKFKDPDEVAINDIQLLKATIKKALPIYDFYYFYISKKFNLDDVYEKSKAAKFILDKMKNIDDDVMKSVYIKKYSDFFDVKEDIVYKELNKNKYKPVDLINSDILQNKKEPLDQRVIEDYFIALLFNLSENHILKSVKKIDSDYFLSKNAKYVFDKLKNIENDFKIQQFYDNIISKNSDMQSYIQNLSLYNLDDNLSSSSNIKRELAKAIYRLKGLYINRQLKLVSKEMKKAESGSNDKLLASLQKKYQKLYKDKLQ